MNDQDCYKLYQDANLDTTEDMQCFGTRYNGAPQGACNGDSGGHYLLEDIISWRT